jgi:hypothetical protein
MGSFSQLGFGTDKLVPIVQSPDKMFFNTIFLILKDICCHRIYDIIQVMQSIQQRPRQRRLHAMFKKPFANFIGSGLGCLFA